MFSESVHFHSIIMEGKTLVEQSYALIPEYEIPVNVPEDEAPIRTGYHESEMIVEQFKRKTAAFYCCIKLNKEFEFEVENEDNRKAAPEEIDVDLKPKKNLAYSIKEPMYRYKAPEDSEEDFESEFRNNFQIKSDDEFMNGSKDEESVEEALKAAITKFERILI